MLDAIVLWLHILGAVVFIGPQIFLAAIAVPAVRSIEDAQTRQRTMRAVTRGFGTLGGIALGVLIVTGLWNYKVANDNNDLDIKRYFITLQIKLLLVVIVVILTALHAMVLGRRLQELQESNASEAEIADARRNSMLVSIGTLVISIAILFCAALLGSDWSHMGGLR